MGGRSSGGNRNSDSSTRDVESLRAQAAEAIRSISANRGFNGFTVERPDDGHNIRVTVEKITTRDYWGKSTGVKTYTVYVWDETQRNEYDNSTRLYYNYGVEKLSDIKDTLRRIILGE